MHVYTLGCAAFHDAENSRPIDVFHFLRVIESVPKDGVPIATEQKTTIFTVTDVQLAGAALGLSRAVAYRNWKYARAWLREALKK